jgi:hypothetical protein
VFRRNRFLAGAEAADLRWYTPAGAYLEAGDWSDPNALAIALYLDGSDAPDRAADGTWLIDDDFLVLVNAWWEPLDFTLPDTRPQAEWRAEIDTFDPAAAGSAATRRRAGDQVTVGPRSVLVLLKRGVPGQLAAVAGVPGQHAAVGAFPVSSPPWGRSRSARRRGGAPPERNGLQSLWRRSHHVIRCGCPIHAARTTWLGHPRRIAGWHRDGRPGITGHENVPGTQEHQGPQLSMHRPA